MTAKSKYFSVPLASLGARLDAVYARDMARRPAQGSAGFTEVRLGDLASLFQYGSSTLASTEPIGTPILRMNNLQDDGWDLSDLKYVDFDAPELEKYRLLAGDVLVNRTNGSKELVGKSQVFDQEGDWVFASYLIRIRVNEWQLLPAYLSAFLNSELGRAQVTASSRQILQTNISVRELKELRIPLPPLDIQSDLVHELDSAREERDARLLQVQQLIDGIGQGFMARLGLPEPPQEQPKAFRVRSGDLTGQRLDAPAYRPVYSDGAREGSFAVRPLDEIASIDPPRPRPQGATVAYAGLPECGLLDVERIIERPYGDVSGRKTFQYGDLLMARIEPSVFNMKYPWVRNADVKKHDAVYTSTEFYIVQGTDVTQGFLFAALRSAYVQAQVRGRTTGSSGRRRLDRSLLLRLAIPVPDAAGIQEVDQFSRWSLDRIASLQALCALEWGRAKERFESALTSGSGVS